MNLGHNKELITDYIFSKHACRLNLQLGGHSFPLKNTALIIYLTLVLLNTFISYLYLTRDKCRVDCFYSLFTQVVQVYIRTVPLARPPSYP